MADKRIQDYPTKSTPNDTDLLLVSDGEHNYNMTVGTLKKAVKAISDQAAATANAANSTAQSAKTAAEQAVAKANAADSAAQKANTASGQAVTTANAANSTAQSAKTAAEQAVAKANASDSAAQKANTASGQAVTTANAANSTAQSAKTAAEQAVSKAASAVTTANAADSTAQSAKTAAEQAVAKAASAVTTANAADSTAQSAKTAAEQAVSKAASADTAAKKAQEASEQAFISANSADTMAKSAQKAASDAKVSAGNAENDAAAALEKAEDVSNAQSAMIDDIASKIDGAYVENGYLYLTRGDEVAAGPLGPFSGSGGGGGASSGLSMSFRNLLDSRALTVSGDGPVYLRYQYACADEEGNDDGDGIGALTVNGVRVATITILQGDSSLDVSGYLVSGTNTVKVTVTNSEGSSRSLSYTVTVVALSVTTTFDAMGTYIGAVIFGYTVTGSGTKTVHFCMDGVEFGTEEVTSSGRSRSYTIPEQNLGAHILTVYADVTIDGTAIQSNILTVGMMWISDQMSDTAILSTFGSSSAVQGDIINIPYMVYDAQTEITTVTLSIINPDGTVYSAKDISVDRSAQTWVAQNYPVGNIIFRISSGGEVLDLPVVVSESGVAIEPITDALALCFDPTGRSNLEDNPAIWTDGEVSATFRDIGFTQADGWQTDADGASLLRVLPGGEVTIPFKLFDNDARSSGATIEVEMATHNVRDYDTVVMSCLSGGRGFKIASQYAQIRSEQSELSMQFKEDEKVRVSFAVEPRTVNRMIYIFVDGVMCGAVQYPTDDDFSQSPSVGITIGAESSGIDLYKIRLYTKGLTRYEVLDNYIADRPVLGDRITAAKRNDVFDLSDNIVISKLPATLPYMVIMCPELPQFKGDKKTCQIVYVNPSDTARSFTAVDAQIDVQGTSSAGYKKKNWKIKLKNGVTYTVSGEAAEKYMLRDGEIPTGVYCMKADVASSEGANNVELVRLYNDIVPHKTPAQKQDARVRVGIDGLPIIIFWQNTDTNEVRFWGKYNFNYDKGSEEVYGLTTGCESWEICNNTSNRVLFKSSDFTDATWQDDFEARYPDGNTDYTKLKAMCDWVVSTDRSAVSTEEDKAARLQKFVDEFEDHFIKAPMLFYYLFTETFLMVDSRAKNFFPTTFDGVHWFPFPYDFDTAIGINNEGQLVFDYDLEDTDIVDGDVVFNGQDSVLWCNIRDAFADEIREMYSTLRGATGTDFSYEKVVKRFADHQSVWPEAVWNEDAWQKYLEPLENDNDSSYLTMLQGSKASQREWWLFNGFRYRDSKYQCGDAEKNFITIRCYEVGNITVTPYSHIHPRIKYGSYTVTERGKRNVATTLICPLDTMSDTEVYIYSADRLASIGDLSGMMVGYANFSMAVKLQSLKLGDGASTYQNTRLNELYVGNNELLTSLDVQNCVNLAMTVDLSGCIGIETILAKGTKVTGFTLPVGAKLHRLELPDTVTNLTLRDLAQFTTLDVAGYGELTTLRVENTPNVPLEKIINGAEKLSRVRLIGMEWEAASNDTLQASITRLKSCIGLDASGNNTAAAVVTGRVYVPSISAELLTEINEVFPQLVVVADGEPQYIVRYLDWDNTVLYRAVVSEGANAVNAVTAGYIVAPTREGTEDTGYTFKDFGQLPTNIRSNVTVVAQYITTYRVRFMNGESVYNEQWIAAGGSATTPSGTPTKASTAQYSYTFSRWDGSYTNITGPVDVIAVYTSTVRKYTVYFYNGSTLLQTVTEVPYGGTATYTGSTPVDPSGNEAAFEGWSPSNTNIKGNTSCYAQFASALEVAEITDDWDTILASIADGTYKSKYKVGNYKPLDLGSEGIINMQIAGFNKDTLADGSGTAAISWISKELLKTSHRMNPALVAKKTVTFDPAGTYLWGAVEGETNSYESTNAGVGNTTSTGCWKITSEGAGTLTVSYTQSGENNYDYMELYVDGTAAFTGKGAGQDVSGTHEVTLSPGVEVTVLATFTKDGSGDKGNDKGVVTFSSDVVINVEVPTSSMSLSIPAQEGTGAIGGWEKSEMRSYLIETIKPLIPDPVLSAIKAVTKTHTAYDTNQSSFSQTTADEVWLPDYKEMFNSSRPYKALFPDNASRIKYKVGASNAAWWWLRSATTNNYFDSVGSIGGANRYNANSSGAVVLGFCT